MPTDKTETTEHKERVNASQRWQHGGGRSERLLLQTDVANR